MKMPGPLAVKRTAALIDRFRVTLRMPTMAEKIACIATVEELEAFRLEYIARGGALPVEVFRALTQRRQELEAGKP